MTEFADNLVRIEALLYIPATLVDDESFPPLFKEFCDDLPERKSSQIYKKIPLLKGLDSGADEFDVADRLMRASASGFLLNAATPARNYHSAGRGFTWSWGDYWCEWLYAADAGLIQSVAVAWAQARAASDKLQAA